LLDLNVTDTNPDRARDIANAVAVRFTAYIKELEQPNGQATSPVRVAVTNPAITPKHSDGPNRLFYLLLGMLSGVVIGAIAALLRDSLDRNIGGRNDASAIAKAPVLAAVMDDSSVKESPLIIQNPFSPRAEAFRQLRTNIRFLLVDRQVKSLVVTSSVEGEGKTTTACNLAIAIAQGGANVVLIDADLRRPTVADIFALSSGVGLTSVLLADLPLGDALQLWRDDLSLNVLTSGPLPPNPSELISSYRMGELVDQLTANGYTVVIDSPPLLPVTDGAVLARVTDGALVVARAASTKVEQLAGAVSALDIAGATTLGVVVNRLPKRARGAYGTYGTGYTPSEHNTMMDVENRPIANRAHSRRAARRNNMATPASGIDTPTTIIKV
jgi:capsular exopolysaccharide synthesis family protein